MSGEKRNTSEDRKENSMYDPRKELLKAMRETEFVCRQSINKAMEDELKEDNMENKMQGNTNEEPKTIEEKIELTLSLNETELKKEAVDRITAIISDELRNVLYKETRGYYGSRDYVPTKATEDIIRSWLDEHQDLVIEAVVDKVASKLTHSNPLRERIAQLTASKILKEQIDNGADQGGLASAT